jgi:hypothetical protein
MPANPGEKQFNKEKSKFYPLFLLHEVTDFNLVTKNHCD